MSPSVNSVQWTIHDLEVLPQNEWNRYEIIAGELFVTRAPHWRHQHTSQKIARYLDEWSERSGSGKAIMAPGIIFADSDSVIPDVVWISQERLAQIEDEAGHLLGAPELIVEVLSPGSTNERRDSPRETLPEREAKRKQYSVYGVQEYWICDCLLRQVEVYRRQDAVLTLVATLMGQDEITSPLLPNFRCAIARFFS